MVLPAGITWPDVAYALVISIPAIIAAFYGRKNSSSLKTGNDKSVGEMVTEAHGALSEEATSFPTHETPSSPANAEGTP